MKVYRNLFEKIISAENLLEAWDDFKRGKRRKADVQLFERRLGDNIFQLHRDLIHKRYRHGEYVDFYVRDPKFGYDKKEINEIANFAFIGGKTNRQILNKEPVVYLEKEIIAKKGEEAIKLQLIPLDRKLWEIANFREFLGWRRKAISDEINNFMQKLE